MDEALLLTANVTPGASVPALTLKDPDTRLLQYVASYIMWAREGPFTKAVLCENSGCQARLAELPRLVKRGHLDLEVLVFQGNEESSERGKGFGEGRIVEYALLHSKTLAEAGGMWKVTGRLYVPNSWRVASEHAPDPNVFGFRGTRYYKMRTALYKYLLMTRYKEVDDNRGRCIEMVCEEALDGALNAGLVTRFRTEPEYLGQCGGSGNWYAPFPPAVMEEAREIAAAIK